MNRDREIKFNCIITGNQKEKIAEFTEWLDGDGWKHDYYSPLVTNGVFSHEELGDGWFGEIIRRQSTGLKDKNGIDIYEGDILERIGTKDNFTPVPMETLSRELIIVELKVSSDNFGSTSFGFSMHTQKTYSERGNPATYKIIGNIYQNPELIKK